MESLRFDGKVALITGAGRGIGLAHARHLASLGAAVVVNDFGVDPSGGGSDTAFAEEAAAEIRASGGKAVASFGDVVVDADRIVQTALDEFGGLDIVVNNAGIDRAQPFGSAVMEPSRKHMDVNYFGTLAITQAAWPHLIASGAGRVVNTTSGTIIGWEEQTPYVASKGAVYTFTRTLALEGVQHGIRVNAVAPGAYTRLVEIADIPESHKREMQTMAPEMVSPVVAYLSHEECGITGETLSSSGGHVFRLSISRNEGYANPAATAEDIRDNLAAILDDSTSAPVALIGSGGDATISDGFK